MLSQPFHRALSALADALALKAVEAPRFFQQAELSAEIEDLSGAAERILLDEDDRPPAPRARSAAALPETTR